MTIDEIMTNAQMTKAIRRSAVSWHPSGTLFALLVLLALVSGCSTTTFSAATLSPEFRVPPTARRTQIDLTRLAVPSAPSSVIGVGDVLTISIATDYEQKGPTNVMARVDDMGSADIAIIGNVKVAGLEPADAEQVIAAAAIRRSIFQRVHITVMIKQKYSNRVTVIGAVEDPGVVELSRANSDLLGALAAAGGLDNNAGTEVQITRKRSPAFGMTQTSASTGVQQASHTLAGSAAGDAADGLPLAPQSERIDLANAAENGLRDYRLSDGDIVMVYEQEPRVVHVLGLVNEPQQIAIPPNQDMRLLDAIARAKGRTMQLADKVQVIRHVPGRPEPILIDVSVRQAKRNGAANLLLAPEDIVTVEETPVTFVLGTLQKLIRVGISGTTPLF